MTHDLDLIAAEPGERRFGRARLPPLPRWLVRSLLGVGCSVLVITALPRSQDTERSAPVSPAEFCVPAEQHLATEARLRAREAQRAQIRAVPGEYRAAARRASRFTHGRVPAEFFLALAYNRTLYGAMLTGAATRPYAVRGPVQWDLREFASAAEPGHRNAAKPLDSFLAVAAVLRRAGAGEQDDAFALSLLFGSGPDQARADAEAFDVLTRERPPAPSIRRCRTRA
jgi:hypothetical protein